MKKITLLLSLMATSVFSQPVLTGRQGGTGVDNNGKTITLGASILWPTNASGVLINNGSGTLTWTTTPSSGIKNAATPRSIPYISYGGDSLKTSYLSMNTFSPHNSGNKNMYLGDSTHSGYANLLIGVNPNSTHQIPFTDNPIIGKRNKNSSCFMVMQNDSSGNQALAGFQATNDLGNDALIISTSSTFNQFGLPSDVMGIGGFGSGGIFMNTFSSAPIIFNTNNSEKMRILSGGNVGIGTSTPTAKLDVVGTGTASTSYAIKISNQNNAPMFRVREDGYIGAGASWGSSGSISMGNNTGYDSTLIHNTVFGYQGLGGNGENVTYPRSLTTGYRNTLFGALNAFHLTTGYQNTLIGDETGEFFETAFGCVGVGAGCMNGNKTSQSNTAVGLGALAGQFRVSGGQLVACNTFPTNSTAVGYEALNTDTTTDTNDAFGFESLQKLEQGNTNACFGQNTLGRLTFGISNTAIGGNAGALVIGASHGNTLVGALAGYGNFGSYQSNTIIGASAGQSLTTGSGNIIIGHLANANQWSTLNSTLWIDEGNNAIPTIYGNIATGRIGLGTISPDTRLHIVGNLKQVDGSQANGNVLTSDAAGIGTWAAPAYGGMVSHNDLTAQTTTVSVTSYTTTSDGTFRVGGYVNTTSVTTDVAQLQVTYTDENNTPQTEVFQSNALSGSISSVGNFPMLSMDIRVKTGTVITVKVALTTSIGSITYDAGGNITKLY